MAIDSAQKRYATLSIAQVFLPGLVPDGAIDQGDRQAIAFSYNGILADALIPVTKFNQGMLSAQHVRRKMHRGRR